MRQHVVSILAIAMQLVAWLIVASLCGVAFGLGAVATIRLLAP